MLCYNYETIRKLVQPLMEMMKTEFPNDCELVIDANSAQIVFKHNHLTFLSEAANEELKEASGKLARKIIEACENMVEKEEGRA